MARRSANVHVMMQAAERASRHLVRDFGEVENLQVSLKGPGDFVSAADRRAEEILRRELGRARPDFGFLMEESGETAGKDPERRWIVDPLDGTTNFLHGLPQWCISIALEEQGEITAGVICDPIKDEWYHADRGEGAFLNNRRLRVSGRNELAKTVIGCGIPVLTWEGREKGFQGQLDRVSAKVAGVRRYGACALDLAYVAAGRFDGFWEYVKAPWDVAAGIILVREAGGLIAHLDGGQDLLAQGTLIAANPTVFPKLESLLREDVAAVA